MSVDAGSLMDKSSTELFAGACVGLPDAGSAEVFAHRTPLLTKYFISFLAVVGSVSGSSSVVTDAILVFFVSLIFV